MFLLNANYHTLHCTLSSEPTTDQSSLASMVATSEGSDGWLNFLAHGIGHDLRFDFLREGICKDARATSRENVCRVGLSASPGKYVRST